MKISVPSFPILNDKRIKACMYVSSLLEAGYRYRGEDRKLTMKPAIVATNYVIKAYNLVDEKGEWNTVGYDTQITKRIQIGAPNTLFGSEGVADSDSLLGIALIIESLSSNQHVTNPISCFGADSTGIDLSFTYMLPKEFYRDKLIFKTVLYLKRAKSKSAIHADLSGTILGILDETSVYIDGTGSLFPIKTESDPSKPLWRVECEWLDPFVDEFTDENVRLIFNKAHPSYSALKLESGLNGSPLLADALASALQIIITKALASVKDLDEMLNADGAAAGSILDAVRYFISTFGWDPSSPERLAESIRLDFDRRLTNDN